MPEGHTLRRLADDLTAAFAGHPVRVSSPQGRFADSAALLDGSTLLGADSAGKHLFLDFGGDRLVQIHLGLIGGLDIGEYAAEAGGAEPAPVGQVRLRLLNDTAYADLRGAMVCELITEAKRDAIVAKLGADPLRVDADPERAWARVHKSARAIGDLLMDQKVFAGVGNVYRAEVLFRQRIHPLRPGNTLQRKQFDAIWADLVALMAEGVRLGRIDTVRPEHTPEAMGRPPRVDDHGGEVYVYRRTGLPCHVCGTSVRTAVLAGRNSFWCPTCQRPYRARTVASRRA
ncbi:MAG: zinc finger domain-containing protein [Nocardioidaceae bacterium]